MTMVDNDDSTVGMNITKSTIDSDLTPSAVKIIHPKSPSIDRSNKDKILEGIDFIEVAL
jgi:hypothetical protein